VPTPEEVREAGLQAMLDALLDGADDQGPTAEARAHAAAIADLLDDDDALAELLGDDEPADRYADFVEEDHPRDERGRFGGGGGGEPPKPDALRPTAAKVHASLGKSLHQNPGLDAATKEKYSRGLHRVLSRMPERAVATLGRTARTVSWHQSSDALTRAVTAKYPESSAQKVSKGGVYRTSGAYVFGQGELFLDGDKNRGKDQTGPDRSNVHETYAHELSHALDMRFTGGQHSDSPEFREAWAKEIAEQPDGRAKLSRYAATSPAEGWAEFGRMLYATDVPHEVIERHFPLTSAIWKARGLWPEEKT
jgi:hypothetical protein